MQDSRPSAPCDSTDADPDRLLAMMRLQAETIDSQAATIGSQAETIASQKHQLDWFKHQLFGAKSERFIAPDPQQMHLGEVLPLPEDSAPVDERVIPSHKRKLAKSNLAEGDAVRFFDESKVPVETIEVANEQCADLSADQFEVIGEKISYRLAQRPGSFVVLKYVRPVIKLRATQKIICPPAPRGVIEGSRADVSFCAGLLVDKFAYHNPLYRQHQKLQHNGITVSRGWLTQIAQQCIALLEPIHHSLPIDTSHLERALRVIPMGRKNWLFCWTELGAKHVGIIQSLIATCRLHGVDPYTYLVDVLQRVSQHSAAQVAELTPRLWAQHFADNPQRSDLYKITT